MFVPLRVLILKTLPQEHKKGKAMRISVIIPVYNEEKGIGQSLDEVKSVLAQAKLENEIIVVNDGSIDKTAAIAAAKGVRLISHDINLGYGAAIKTGVRHSSFETIVITDGDRTYPADEIPRMLGYIGDYDMVVGARVGDDVKIPISRRFAKNMLIKFANYLSDSKILDLNSGLRVINKDAFNKFLKLLPNGFSLTTTITLSMLTAGLQIKYVPINYRFRIGKSKIRPIRDTLNFIQLIVRTGMMFNPLKIFVPLSLLLFFAAFFVFLYSLYFLPYRLDVTAIVLFVAGIQILALGMIADLINKRIE